MNLVLIYALFFVALCWIATAHTTLFISFFISYPGRLCLILYIMAVTIQNRLAGMLLAISFMIINVYYIIKATPNLIPANSATFFEDNFLEENRIVLDKKIKYENYVFVKPYRYPYSFSRPNTNNRILPYYTK